MWSSEIRKKKHTKRFSVLYLKFIKQNHKFFVLFVLCGVRFVICTRIQHICNSTLQFHPHCYTERHPRQVYQVSWGFWGKFIPKKTTTTNIYIVGGGYECIWRFVVVEKCVDLFANVFFKSFSPKGKKNIWKCKIEIIINCWTNKVCSDFSIQCFIRAFTRLKGVNADYFQTINNFL